MLDNRYTDMITCRVLPRQPILPPGPPVKLTPSLSCSWSLLCAPKKRNSHKINSLQPLFPKHPGWGYPNASMGHPGTLSGEKERRRSCSSITTFRINTCKSVSKQSTLTTFRMNTYEKRGEGGSESVWQLGLTLALYCRERRSAGWPTFWSTTRSKLTCCRQR